MKNRLWMKLSLVVFSAALLVPTSIAKETAQASIQETKHGEPYIKAYDAKGNLLKSYSDKEIAILIEEAEESDRLLAVKSKNNEGSPAAYFYDENNLLIDSTDKDAVNVQKAAIAKLKASGCSVYRYDSASFRKHVTVAGGRYFKNPQSMTVSPQQQADTLVIQAYKQGASAPAGSIQLGNFSGSVHVPLVEITQHTLGAGNYKIQLGHADSAGHVTSLKSGTLYYQ
ncbi:hypothetical protein [Pseudobacillus badius]|uniref:hypothetical protein n=1 Tax=Bacillus badius TaxID=1455 RepID=UPI001CBED4B1|nr:hypothetical protein [Bacillus badius]UAT32926.1 hypothetical protein K7T73_19960 [Bacillus badius]GLY12665.1 hypothetical protein Bbad01_38810 [Bacillus badius]